ncbi:coenzyme F420-0:L-glutamate ligase [Spongisporangium articulatum]|uniref:Coenzyme F420-0:L-glutamate ligase n=1 Tax=Spongisporangium articulatum TaxID=3362603 RepID=A0ABW8APV1_9ACTN
MTRLQVFGIPGVGEVRAGADLAADLLDALAAAGTALAAGDVLVVSSKVVSKAEGRAVPATTRDALVAAETVRLVARRRTPNGLAQVVQAQAGPVMAAAGVDLSNVEPGSALLLPVDPDASARALRARLTALGAPPVGVVLSDTAGRAWRDGQVDFALGAAGIRITEDLRGGTDTYGQPLEVTVRALVDEVAAAGDLVKGKTSGVPAAVVRGVPELVTDDDGPGAAALLRPAGEDWFRFGQVEAVRAALGVAPDAHEPPAVPREDVETRLRRAVTIALAARDPWPAPPLEADVSYDGDRAVVTTTHADDFSIGALAQRIAAALWSEDLAVHAMRVDGGCLSLVAALINE